MMMIKRTNPLEMDGWIADGWVVGVAGEWMNYTNGIHNGSNSMSNV